ncbi:pre-mRNA-splicing factor Cwc21p [Diutina catenulata]
MSYNGIGLQTPRGTGTSGHIQKSLGHKDRDVGKNYTKRQKDASAQAHEHHQREKEARQDEERDHQRRLQARKRRIEVECSELRDRLEDESEDDDEVERQVAALREKLAKEQVVDYVPLSERKREKSPERARLNKAPEHIGSRT